MGLALTLPLSVAWHLRAEWRRVNFVLVQDGLARGGVRVRVGIRVRG